MRTMVRVLVAAANRVYRESIVELLSRRGFVVVAAVSVVEEAAARVEQTRIDVAVVDVSSVRATAALAMLASSLPRGRTVAIGVPQEPATVAELAERGVVEYAFLNASRDELVAAVTAAAAGVRPEPPLDARAEAVDASAVPLTRREREILELVNEGLSDKEIATRLGVAVSTAKAHVHNMLTKLHLKGRGEAAAWLRRGG